jgi:membrane-associated protease RseP (regulator of RpoE activity)
MGAAGPLAGAAVAFVLLWISVRWATPGTDWPDGSQVLIFQDPLLVKLVGVATTGAAPDPLAHYHPMTMAAWVGCFVTGLNLVPVGQLDGGHVLNALAPRWARRVSRVAPFVVTAGGLLWPGWFLAGALLFFLSVGRPLPVPVDPPLFFCARLVAVCALVVFVLTFLPAPIAEVTVDRKP